MRDQIYKKLGAGSSGSKRRVVLGRGNNFCKDSEMTRGEKVKATSRCLAWMIPRHLLEWKTAEWGHISGEEKFSVISNPPCLRCLGDILLEIKRHLDWSFGRYSAPSVLSSLYVP